MPLIALKDVSKLYGFGDAATIALDEVNVHIEQGEFVAIMGPSGSGKSTLLNMVGLLDRPTHGNYQLGEHAVEQMRPRHQAKIRRDRIGFIFQSFNLLPGLNVLENVALPLAYTNMTKTKRLKQASHMLERIGLSEREYFMPRQLSGGQAQRAAIARALVNNPEIIIADEPTGNLDSAASRLIMELLSDIHKTGNTILMVTHNPGLTRFASRVLFMHDGGIVADEQTAVGELADRVRRSMYFLPRKTVEDDLAGVSSLMRAMPDEPGKEKQKIKVKTKSKPVLKSKKKTASKSTKPVMRKTRSKG